MRQEIRDILDGGGIEPEPKVIPEMPRSEAIGIANVKCVHCKGSGQRFTGAKYRTCDCVYRAIFRACFEHYEDIQHGVVNRSVRMDRFCDGRTSSFTWGRKSEEYLADFYLVAMRHLDAFHGKVFKAHFLEGGDYRECCEALKIDRGTFFHAVYRIEKRIGKVFRELRPYALYPLRDYFDGAGVVESGAIFHRVDDTRTRVICVAAIAGNGFLRGKEARSTW